MLATAKNFTRFFFLISLCFLAIELFLRFVYDIKPGKQFQSVGLKTVDTLILQRGFYGDSLGIQRVDSVAAKIVSERIAKYYSTGQALVVAKNEAKEVYELVNDEIHFEESDFKCPLKSFVSKEGFPATDLDSSVMYYLRHPINADGFRSIAFKRYNAGKKRVLLLGDSFTWGHSAENIFCSFADNLLAMGFAVYNTGISGTDPVQYAQIANQYIPQIRPDVVVMNIYLGNDVQYYCRKPTPSYPQILPTNAGTLQTSFLGITITNKDSIYNLVMEGQNIPIHDSKINKFCSFTAVGTVFWRAMAKFNFLPIYNKNYSFLLREADKISSINPDVNDRVKEVQQLCNLYRAKFFVCIIPQINPFLQLNSPSDFRGLLDSIPYNLSPVKSNGYCQYADGHYNNIGHLQHAEFIRQLIQKE